MPTFHWAEQIVLRGDEYKPLGETADKRVANGDLGVRINAKIEVEAPLVSRPWAVQHCIANVQQRSMPQYGVVSRRLSLPVLDDKALKLHERGF